MRIVLAGATPETRALVAGLLAERLGLPAGDGFVRADPPVDPSSFDAELARRGAEVDALVNLGGAAHSVLDHYGRAVVEAAGADLNGILERLRETLVAG